MPSRLPKLGFSQTARLDASDASRIDQFGHSLCVSGDLMIVGAHYDDQRGYKAGSAYVFRRKGSIWVEKAKLTANDAEKGHLFGEGVACEGDWAAVTAPRAGRQGRVYLYHFNDSQWNAVDYLEPPGNWPGRSRSGFSGALAMHDGHLLVAGAGCRARPHSSGVVYAYRLEGSSWILNGKLHASDATIGDQFGFSLALSGDTAVVGAWFDDQGGHEAGSAYIFRFRNGAWHEEAKLLAPDSAAYDHFGYSVTTFQDVAVIGAPHDDDHGPDSGSVYVFRFRRRRWQMESKLTSPEGSAFGRFGQAVAMRTRMLAVGSPLAVYCFRPRKSQWEASARVAADDAPTGGRFGDPLAVDSNTILVGAPWKAHYGAKACGSVYVFAIAVPPQELHPGRNNEFHWRKMLEKRD